MKNLLVVKGWVICPKTQSARDSFKHCATCQYFVKRVGKSVNCKHDEVDDDSDNTISRNETCNC